MISVDSAPFTPRCPPESIVFDEVRGEVVCVETGEVLEDHMVDYGPEWRVFSHDDLISKKRVGAPLTSKVHDDGMHSIVDRRTPIGRKLSRINRGIRISSRNRRLVKALKTMNSVIGSLNLPNANELREEAGRLIKKLYSKGLIKKKNLRAMVAAAILIATKNLDTPVSKSDIARRCMVTLQELWRAEMKIRRDTDVAVKVKPMDPRQYVELMANSLGLSKQSALLALKIISVAKKCGLTSGKGPRGVAAASLYIASILLDERKTQKEVSRKVDVSEVTIRNRYRDLIDNLVIVVDV